MQRRTGLSAEPELVGEGERGVTVGQRPERLGYAEDLFLWKELREGVEQWRRCFLRDRGVYQALLRAWSKQQLEQVRVLEGKVCVRIGQQMEPVGDPGLASNALGEVRAELEQAFARQLPQEVFARFHVEVQGRGRYAKFPSERAHGQAVRPGGCKQPPGGRPYFRRCDL